ncbi:MAG: hypothetical protein M3418_00590 [Gemmatimonadota bacterium]|nr:hypothetical protein [Gemmatimonadota bacterium]
MRDSSPEQMDEIGAEYDLTNSRPNPYAERYAEDTRAVLLDPDVARVFPDAKAVNDALRALAKIIEERTQHAA